MPLKKTKNKTKNSQPNLVSTLLHSKWMKEGQTCIQNILDFKVENKEALEPGKSIEKERVASNVKRTQGCSWVEGVPFNGPEHSRTAMVDSN